MPSVLCFWQVVVEFFFLKCCVPNFHQFHKVATLNRPVWLNYTRNLMTSNPCVSFKDYFEGRESIYYWWKHDGCVLETADSLGRTLYTFLLFGKNVAKRNNFFYYWLSIDLHILKERICVRKYCQASCFNSHILCSCFLQMNVLKHYVCSE